MNITKNIMLAFMLSASTGAAAEIQVNYVDIKPDYSIEINNVKNYHQIRFISAVLVKVESGGKQSGGAGSVAGENEPTTSHKGAIGAAQVLLSTAIATAKKHHIKWNLHRFRTDPTYNERIGRLYLSDQLTNFKGNLPKALAAYNAGPGAVTGAIKLAKKNGQDWFSLLPKETREYVPKNLKRLSIATQGTPWHIVSTPRLAFVPKP